jgi:hypothetical protein
MDQVSHPYKTTDKITVLYVGFEVLSRGYEEFCFLGYNAMKSVESQPAFQRNTSPPT